MLQAITVVVSFTDHSLDIDADPDGVCRCYTADGTWGVRGPLVLPPAVQDRYDKIWETTLIPPGLDKHVWQTAVFLAEASTPDDGPYVTGPSTLWYILASDIRWQLDDPEMDPWLDCDLPPAVVLPFPPEMADAGPAGEIPDEIQQRLVEEISDRYGFAMESLHLSIEQAYPRVTHGR